MIHKRNQYPQQDASQKAHVFSYIASVEEDCEIKIIPPKIKIRPSSYHKQVPDVKPDKIRFRTMDENQKNVQDWEGTIMGDEYLRLTEVKKVEQTARSPKALRPQTTLGITRKKKPKKRSQAFDNFMEKFIYRPNHFSSRPKN